MPSLKKQHRVIGKKSATNEIYQNQIIVSNSIEQVFREFSGIAY
jgi:hypothetical protein